MVLQGIRAYRLESPWEAEAPRLRHELNATRALGQILDRPLWWTASPQIQAQWIQDLDTFVVELHIAQVTNLQEDIYWDDWKSLIPHVLAAAKLPRDSVEKQQAVDKLFDAMVETIQLDEYRFRIPEPESGSEDDYKELYDSEGEWDFSAKMSDVSDDDEGMGEDDSGDEEMLDNDGHVVSYDVAIQQARVWLGKDAKEESTRSDDDGSASEPTDEKRRRDDPFWQLLWVANLLICREKLLALTPEEATHAKITQLLKEIPSDENTETKDRAVAMILAVVSADEEGMRAVVPVSLSASADSVLRSHLKAVRALVGETKADVVTALDLIVRQLGLVVGDTKEEGYVPGPVPLMWLSDRCVPTDVRVTLVAQLAHVRRTLIPQSSSMTKRLVDPSLFCGIKDHTHSIDAATVPTSATPAAHMRELMNVTSTSAVRLWRGRDSTFWWLPSVIAVDASSGDATILTYINNLHPERFATTYTSIERIFAKFVPLFDTILSAMDHKAPERTLERLYRLNGNTLPRSPHLVPCGLFEPGNLLQTLKGQQCDVVVRVIEIELTPSEPEYPGLAWRDEGTDDDDIIATGLFVYASENVSDPRIAFRTFVSYPFYNPDSRVAHELVYGLYKLLYQDLGTVTVVEGRSFVFPNTYQYRLEPFALADATQSGRLGLLKFMLVAPTGTASTSTAMVPPQRADWIEHARTTALRPLALPDSVQKLIFEFVKDGMSVEEAIKRRSQLTAERKRDESNRYDTLSYHHYQDESKRYWATGKRPMTEETRWPWAPTPSHYARMGKMPTDHECDMDF